MGVLPQENSKFSALRMQFSCILRAPQAIQIHKQHLLKKGIILYKIPTGGSVVRTSDVVFGVPVEHGFSGFQVENIHWKCMCAAH